MRILNSRVSILLICILLASLTLHIIFLIENPGQIFNMPEKYNRPHQIYGDTISKYGSYDAARYAGMAFQIMEKGIYGYEQQKSNAYVTPGEPVYLVSIFSVAKWLNVDHLLLVRICTMILSVMTIAIIYLIAWELFEKRPLALIAAFLYASYFSPLHYFRAVLTEIPAIFTFLFALYACIKAIKYHHYKWHIIFGIFFAIAIMFRPSPAPLIIIAIFMALKKYGIKESLKIGLLWAIGPVLIISPWVIRNLMVMHHAYIFSSHSGNPLLMGTDPFYLEKAKSMDLYAQAKELKISQGLSQGQYAWKRFIEGIKSQPNLWISWFTVGKIITLFQKPSGWNYYLPQFKYWSFLVYFDHFFIIFSGFLAGLLCNHNKSVKMLFILLMSYVGISLVFVTIDRYGFFVIPLFCILSAYGMIALKESSVTFVKNYLRRLPGMDARIQVTRM